jgi:hypothetical protein
MLRPDNKYKYQRVNVYLQEARRRVTEGRESVLLSSRVCTQA